MYKNFHEYLQLYQKITIKQNTDAQAERCKFQPQIFSGNTAHFEKNWGMYFSPSFFHKIRAVNSWHDFTDTWPYFLCSLRIIYVGGGRGAADEGIAYVCINKHLCSLLGASPISR